jgi:type IV pilus assembly protein PilC
MFSSGVPLVSALVYLGEQGGDATLARTADGLANGLQAGKSLSRSMQDFPNVFSVTQRRLTQAGETSGRLGHVLATLSKYEEERLKLQRQVSGALVTPLLVCSVCLVMVIILPPYFLYGMLRMLSETGGTLPWPTQLLMNFSEVLRSPAFQLVAVTAAVASPWLYRKLAEQQALRIRLWTLALRLPVLGGLLQQIAVIRFSQTLVNLLQVGLPILAALPLSAQAAGNPILEGRIQNSVQALKDGEPLSQALAHAEFFPKSWVMALVAGEESGDLDRMLSSLADLYSVDLEQKVSALIATLEPLMMMVIGIIVGFTSLAAILPLLKIVETL